MTSTPLIPSDDWELNIVLLKIARQLEKEDLDAIKFLCSGHSGVPKGVLEKLTTPEKLFTYLRERCMLSRDNLLLLQTFLWHVGRNDLMDIAADYARRAGDTLYFYAPTTKPENGFKHVKFHVDGDLVRFQRKELEDMRANVARLLFVPAEYIFLCGVEPANSLLLTFMLHSSCVDRLKTVFRTSGGVLNKLGIDTLYVDDVAITIQENSTNDVASSTNSVQTENGSCTTELQSLFRKTVELEAKLEETDVRLLTSREEVESIEKQAHQWHQKESYVRGLLCAALDGRRMSTTSDGVPSIVVVEDGRIII